MSTAQLLERVERGRGTARIRVAVAGCGAVGGELVRALLRDERYELVRVLVQDASRPRVIDFPPDLLTDDVDSFIATRADIVGEATGDVPVANRIGRAALGRGARFVTANKALISADGDVLARLGGGSESGGHGAARRLQFDAAVGGGVPIIRILRNALAGAPIQSVEGILNGTSNFVLSRLEQGAPIDAVLAEARARGLAEADPSRDLDGRDVADKIAIIAWIAFGIAPDKVRVERHGLLPDPARLVADAHAMNGVVRLLGTVRAVSGVNAVNVATAVEPVIVGRDSAFARTTGEANRAFVDVGWTSPIELAGPGAGGAPTAAAMLADIRRACPPLPPTDAAAACVDDPARYRWSVSALDLPHVESPFEAAGVPITARTGSGRFTRLIVGPSERSELRSVMRSLRAIGAEPLLARLAVEAP